MNDEIERVRREGRIFGGIVMGTLVGLLPLFFAQKVISAEEVKAQTWETYTFPDGQGALSISNQPCSVPVALERWERIRAGVQAQHNVDIGEIRQSRLLWNGVVYAGCYAVGPDNDHVYNIDSTGEGLKPTIPREAFVPHESVLPAGKTKV